MERKSRTIFVVLIAVVIVVAVFYSFGLNLFPRDTPHIVLPTAMPTDRPVASQPVQEDGVLWVGVTPETVQSIIATLHRPDNYCREITVQYGAGGMLHTTVWVDGDWTRSATVSSESGTTRHSIVGDGTLYYWYDGARAVRTAPADAHSADLDGAHIPTFEDVLALDPATITETGFEEKSGEQCVYLAVYDPELDQEQRYWVSTGSYCLLVAAELTRDDTVLLQMSSGAMEQPVPDDTSFALPDGTVLHEILTAPAPAADPA